MSIGDRATGLGSGIEGLERGAAGGQVRVAGFGAVAVEWDGAGDGLLLAPFSGAGAEAAGEHEVEKAQGFIATFEGDFDDFGLAVGEEFTGAGEADFGAFFAEGHADEFVEKAA